MISLATFGGGPRQRPPVDLDEVGREFWVERIAELRERGVALAADVLSLCHHFALAQQRRVRTTHDLYATESRRPRRPSKAWLRIERKLHTRRMRASDRWTSLWLRFRRLIADGSSEV